MTKFQLTQSQHDAIYDRSPSILISAGAGSGKTSVLSQRVAALVSEGADVSRMLICTFTSPAAAEMRTRISAQLFSLAEERGDRRLAAQAELALSADICTIHRFSLKLLREQAVSLGLPTDLRVLGERAELIRINALDDALEELYERDDEHLLYLRERFSGRDDDALRELLLSIYAALRSKEEGIDWLHAPAESDLRELLAGQVKALLYRALSTLQVCRDISNRHDIFTQLEKDEEDINYVRILLRTPIDALESAAALGKIQRIGRKFPSDEVKKNIQDRKANARALIKSAVALSRADISGELAYTQRVADALRSVLTAFDKQYTREKKERGAVDFDDILSLAADALSRPQIAAEYASRYDHVFIDEYQDTNPIQESLLGKIGAPNVFMVGDVKQAIYRFRLAAPEIFLEKAQHGAGRVIHMNENFRSSAGVISAVNHVMSSVMSPALGEMEYTDDQVLRARGDFSGGAELLLTQPPEGQDDITAEARSIANRILELVGSVVIYRGQPRTLRFGDFAVLMRSPKTHSRAFYQVFEEAGVPSSVQTGSVSGLFEPEVFVNLLRIIDGARSDIALLSVMRSHIGGFSDEDIAVLRANSDCERFSQCVSEYDAKDELAERIQAFYKKLNRWRLMSHGVTVHKLISNLRYETDYDAFVRALPGGGRRLYLLDRFFERLMALADECESLFELIEDLDKLKREKGAYFELPSELDDDRVRIMSIHKSKGLEFPVVILARMNRTFTSKDLSAKLLFHPELGAASDIIDPERKTEDKSRIKELLASDLKSKNKSEELRILYVAMTRASNILVFSGTTRDPHKLIGSLSALQRDDMPALTSHLDWVLSALLRLNCFSDWNENAATSPEISIAHSICTPQSQEGASELVGRTLESCLEAAAGQSVRALPVMPRASVPSKIGVSTLTGSFCDDSILPPTQKRMDGGAQLGTLVHLFMLHLDYSARDETQVRAQMDSLIKKRIFTPEEGRRVMQFAPNIAKYLTSELAYRIRSSENVMRELPFTLAVSARDIGIADSDERTLVQGIIDLAFEENGRIVILDYKTNYVPAEGLFEFLEHYQTQLDLYEKAMRVITKKPVSSKYLYLLREGRAIDVS